MDTHPNTHIHINVLKVRKDMHQTLIALNMCLYNSGLESLLFFIHSYHPRFHQYFHHRNLIHINASPISAPPRSHDRVSWAGGYIGARRPVPAALGNPMTPKWQPTLPAVHMTVHSCNIRPPPLRHGFATSALARV